MHYYGVTTLIGRSIIIESINSIDDRLVGIAAPLDRRRLFLRPMLLIDIVPFYLRSMLLIGW